MPCILVMDRNTACPGRIDRKAKAQPARMLQLSPLLVHGTCPPSGFILFQGLPAPPGAGLALA